MSPEKFPPHIREVIRRFSGDERSIAFALAAVIREADANGSARFKDVAIRYRDEYLHALRAEGRDAEREAGRLGLDEVRSYLAGSIIPRLVGDGALVPPAPDPDDVDARVQLSESLWHTVAPIKSEISEVFRQNGDSAGAAPVELARPAPSGSILEAKGLVKTYRRRAVVNDVALRLQQGEIVGLLGPNGAARPRRST